MKDQHEKIAGYRDLNEAELASINALKVIEEEVRGVLDRLDYTQCGDAQRWLSIARTHLETGFMFAIKAVAKPTNGLGRNR